MRDWISTDNVFLILIEEMSRGEMQFYFFLWKINRISQSEFFCPIVCILTLFFLIWSNPVDLTTVFFPLITHAVGTFLIGYNLNSTGRPAFRPEVNHLRELCVSPRVVLFWTWHLKSQIVDAAWAKNAIGFFFWCKHHFYLAEGFHGEKKSFSGNFWGGRWNRRA